MFLSSAICCCWPIISGILMPALYHLQWTWAGRWTCVLPFPPRRLLSAGIHNQSLVKRERRRPSQKRWRRTVTICSRISYHENQSVLSEIGREWLLLYSFHLGFLGGGGDGDGRFFYRRLFVGSRFVERGLKLGRHVHLGDLSEGHGSVSGRRQVKFQDDSEVSATYTRERKKRGFRRIGQMLLAMVVVVDDNTLILSTRSFQSSLPGRPLMRIDGLVKYEPTWDVNSIRVLMNRTARGIEMGLATILS